MLKVRLHLEQVFTKCAALLCQRLSWVMNITSNGFIGIAFTKWMLHVRTTTSKRDKNRMTAKAEISNEKAGKDDFGDKCLTIWWNAHRAIHLSLYGKRSGMAAFSILIISASNSYQFACHTNSVQFSWHSPSETMIRLTLNDYLLTYYFLL